MYPSIGTSVNRKTNIQTDDDITELCNEVEQISPSDLIDHHIVTRLQNDHSSGLRVTRILAMKMFITKYEYTVRGLNDNDD